MTFVKDLDTPLLQLSPLKDIFYLRDATQGVHAFGQIGSGKTTATLASIFGAYARAGMGGILTVCKPADVEMYRRLAPQHGRALSLILFDEHEGFNFITYELARHGMDGVGTVTECLMRILEASKRASATASQRGGMPFWEDATRQALRYTIPPIYAAQGTVSVSDIIAFLTSAPQRAKDLTDPKWGERSFMNGIMQRAKDSPVVPMAPGMIENMQAYWSKEFPAIPEETRGNIVISVTTVLDRFKHGRLSKIFCSKTTVVPEMTFHGAIIVLCMPTTVWNEDGIIAQCLFKFLWQRSVLTRNSLAEQHRERPVFLISDEAQETVSSYDGEFLGLCRDSMACVVSLSQSLPTYYTKIGGDNPRDAAQGLIGKFGTHVFHANACAETNEYAARTIGKAVVNRKNYSEGSSRSYTSGMNAGNSTNSGSSSGFGYSHGGSGTQSSSSHSYNSSHTSGSSNNWGHNRGQSTSHSSNEGCTEVVDYVIEPGEFARILKTGGKRNHNLVTAVWFQSSRVFNVSGTNIILETFKQ